MKRQPIQFIIVALASVAAWQIWAQSDSDPQTATSADSSTASTFDGEAATATFAGGCFWCMEPPFEKLDGVIEVVSGYTGGHVADPTYKQVCTHSTGHVEAVQIRFDPSKIAYDDLIEVFWRQVDPTDDGGQFVDRGSSYLSAIFVHDDTQRMLAEKSLKKLEESGRFDKPIVTPIRDAAEFYRAEEYHQDYYKKHKVKYGYYRHLSGRDRFVEMKWGEDRIHTPAPPKMMASANPLKDDLKSRLTDLQYRVTQHDDTEPPFSNEFWNNKRPGVYVDVVSGEALFSSTDKFKSGTGWPSFSKPIDPDHLVEKQDRKLFAVRTEVRSRDADSHLGHVFDDGPAPTGRRYCINSAALRFVPADELASNGLESYQALFADMEAKK